MGRDAVCFANAAAYKGRGLLHSPVSSKYTMREKGIQLMRKSVVPRLLGIGALYGAVFIVLVLIQFTGMGNFIRQAGDMTISGQLRPGADREAEEAGSEYELNGNALVNFGGMEFSLKKDGLVLIGPAGERQPAAPAHLSLRENAARFRLDQGTELVFVSLFSGGGSELRISAEFNGEPSALELPFKPQRSSVVRDPENGQMSVRYEDTYYQFAGSAPGEDAGRLLLDTENDSAAYRTAPGQGDFSPADFVISRAGSAEDFTGALTQWRDQLFSSWSQMNPLPADEDTIIAYGGESLLRGNYRTALTAVSPGFLSGSRRGYESAVYLGGMARAIRSLTTADREKLNRISRLISAKSPDLLKENSVFEFLWVRGLIDNVNNGLALVRSINPGSLTLEQVPGVLEGFMDFKRWRPQAENPFEPLLGRCRELVAERIQKNTGKDQVLVYLGGKAESEFNLRLGKALWLWAGEYGDENWAALGRSLALSVLDLADDSGAVPQSLIQSRTGELDEAPEGRISAARLYRIIEPGTYHPRAAALDSGAAGVWAWTAAQAVSATQDSESMEIVVSFPVDETHYMLIRGLRPFARLQLYGVDFPSDSSFERYDSSGWVYYPQDQILALKMKHRENTEHLRIFFRREPPPPPPEPVIEVKPEIPVLVQPEPAGAGVIFDESGDAALER